MPFCARVFRRLRADRCIYNFRRLNGVPRARNSAERDATRPEGQLDGRYFEHFRYRLDVCSVERNVQRYRAVEIRMDVSRDARHRGSITRRAANTDETSGGINDAMHLVKRR